MTDLTLDDVKGFYSRHFTRQSVILGMAGGFSASFLEKVNRDLGVLLPNGPVDKESLLPPDERPESSAIVIEQQATQATTVTFGFSMPVEKMNRAHPDYPALIIALNYFGSGGFSSKLMSEIRVKRGLNYGSNARLRFGGMAFQVNLGAMDSPEIAHFATRLAMYEINKLITEGMDDEKFDFVRNSIVNVLPVAVDTPSKVLSLAVEGFEQGFGEDYLEFMLPALRNTTVAEVNRVIKKWLRDDSVTFVFVTPDAAEMNARLVNETVSTISYDAEEKPEEQLMNDEIIKDYPLGLVPDNIAIKTAEDFFPSAGSMSVQVGDEALVLDETKPVLVSRNGTSTSESDKESDVAEMMASSNGDDIDTLDVEIAVTDDTDAAGDTSSIDVEASAGNSVLNSLWCIGGLLFSAALALVV